MTSAIQGFLARIIDLARGRIPEGVLSDANVRSALARHLSEAAGWSQSIQLLGMAQPQATDSATISLRLNAVGPRFRGSTAGAQLAEEELLHGPGHYVVLGDPGSGKTTMLKRLVRSLLVDTPANDSNGYQLPIVIRMRELGPSQSIAQSVASAIEIPTETVTDFLNASRAVLFLDGLHEVPRESKEATRRELEKMAWNANGSKIIVSCRTGEYREGFEGFQVVEVCRLTASETKAIATLWLNESSKFLTTLSRMPYRELADRPLLLTQLIFIYQRYERLPEQPVAIYRNLVRLLLEEWNRAKRLTTQSRYAAFDADRKLAFLAAVAYHLTRRGRIRGFTGRDLAEIYLQLYPLFQLPRDEEHQVIRELQTHTGIIAITGEDSYEFTHLSLQEYLCAEYVVREPFWPELKENLAAFLPSLAIAVVLSSNPSAWFASLFLYSESKTAVDVRPFLSRLLLERPVFSPSAPMGVAMLKIYRDAGSDAQAVALIDQLLDTTAVGASVSAGLQYYAADAELPAEQAGWVRLRRTRAISDTDRFKTPDIVAMPLRVLDRLAMSGDTHAAAIAAAAR